jgi:hypothetical protein
MFARGDEGHWERRDFTLTAWPHEETLLREILARVGFADIERIPVPRIVGDSRLATGRWIFQARATGESRKV